MQKGREPEALETLRKLRNVEIDDVNGMNTVHRELSDIRTDIQFDERVKQSTSYIEIFHKVVSFSNLTNIACPSTDSLVSLCHGISTIDWGMISHSSINVRLM